MDKHEAAIERGLKVIADIIGDDSEGSVVLFAPAWFMDDEDEDYKTLLHHKQNLLAERTRLKACIEAIDHELDVLESVDVIETSE